MVRFLFLSVVLLMGQTGLAQAASPKLPVVLSCEEQIGARAAKVLADDCRNVSPATRPPCHAANSCSLILGEIVRSCTVFPDMKKQCDPYMKNTKLVKRIKAENKDTFDAMGK